MLAIPAGLLSSAKSPLAFFGLFWMSAAAAWTVVLYVRSQGPTWITIGAGARIGLVTGLIGGWLAFGASGGALFSERFVLHQSTQIDADWKAQMTLNQQLSQQITSGMTPSDAAEAQAAKTEMDTFYGFALSPEGHAGWEALSFASNSVFLLFFAMAGGALGARVSARSRRPEV